MSTIPISQLPAASTLTGTEIMPLVQGGVTVQATAAAFAGLAPAGPTGATGATGSAGTNGTNGTNGAGFTADVVTFGADPTGTTDSAAAINTAIASLANGGTCFFPPGTYLVNSTITMPTTVSVTLEGDGRGDTGGSRIKANAPITGGVITFGTAFFRGHRVANLTIDANMLAQNCINAPGSVGTIFENLSLYNATVASFVLGNGGTSNCQENTLSAVRMDSPAATTLAQLPTYNLHVQAVNNYFDHVVGANAKTANIFSDTTAGGNKYANCHGYNFVGSSATTALVTSNFILSGSEEQVIAFEADGSSSINISVLGFYNTLVGCFSQFQGLTPQKGIVIGGSASNNVVASCVFRDSTAGNDAVITSSSTNNSFFGCTNGTTGNVVGAGAYLISTATAVPLTNSTAVPVVSLALPAGDWDITGNASLEFTTAGTMTGVTNTISTTSGGFGPQEGQMAFVQSFTPGTGFTFLGLPCGPTRVTGPATVYLNLYTTFSGVLEAAQAVIRARRCA